MYKLIAGSEGCGKTKRIIDMANEHLKQTSGSIVFIDDDKRHMYDLKHDLRFISMDEFPVDNGEAFFGFLCGLVSNNYDIESIYVDGLQKMTNMGMEELNQFIRKTDTLAEKYNINFVYTLNYEMEHLPSELKENVI